MARRAARLTSHVRVGVRLGEAAGMSDGSSGAKTAAAFPELLAGVRLMEGRMSANELATRVVRAAMLQPGVAGARLWRVEGGKGAVWACEGNFPPLAPMVQSADGASPLISP